MKNLAGDVGCDSYILDELIKAGIEIVEHPEPLYREVPARLTGKSGKFEFKRCWYYWAVSGPVPLAVAEKMYNHPRGREDVRVAGHCGCPPPAEWEEEGYVESYHIDSQSGLNFFCDTLREAGVLPGWPTRDYSELKDKIIEESRARINIYREKRRRREGTI